MKKPPISVTYAYWKHIFVFLQSNASEGIISNFNDYSIYLLFWKFVKEILFKLSFCPFYKVKVKIISSYFNFCIT